MSDQPETSTQSTPVAGDHDHLADLVQALIGMMQAGNMAELEVEYRDLKLMLRSAQHEKIVYAHAPSHPVLHELPPATIAPVVDENTHVITAPMIGTFYAAPSPNEPAFVRVGEHIEEGQTIGIIEAMKIMNEIAADCSGVVTEIIAGNATTVEYGSPLIRIRPDSQ